MGIQIPTAGAITYGTYSAATVQSICDGLKGLLVSAGWVSAPQPSTGTIVFTGTPADGDGVIIGSVTYTFKTTINNAVPNQISIAAGATSIATRLMEAVNAGAGAGTDYSSATVANPLCSATLDSSTVTRVSAFATGFTASSLILNFPFSHSAMSLPESNNGQANGRGYKLVCPVTPQGLSMAVFVDDVNDTGYARVRASSPNWYPPFGDLGSVTGSDNSGVDGSPGVVSIVTSGRLQQFCGCAHQFFTWVLADSSSPGFVCTCGVPYIRPLHGGIAITGATNATPIQITAAGHGRSTGDDVFIADVKGNTAANGFYTVTVIDANNLTLNGTAGNGAYVSGGTLAGPNQISRSIWFTGQSVGNNFQTFRFTFAPGSTAWFGAVNQYSYSEWNNPSQLFLEYPRNPYDGSPNNGVVLNFGSIPDLIVPVIGWALTDPNSTIMKYGQLWAAFIVQEPLPMDRIKTGFVIGAGTHDCINFTDGIKEPRGSLWLLKS